MQPTPDSLVKNEPGIINNAKFIRNIVGFIPFQGQTTLRHRFLIYLGSLFFLLTALGSVSYFKLQDTIHNFDHAIDHELLNLRQQIYLRDLVSLTNNPVHQYISYGDPTELVLYDGIRREVDELFSTLMARKNISPRQIEIISNSHDQWIAATTAAKTILNSPYPLEIQASKTLLTTYNSHTEGTIDTLYQLHNINLARIEALRRDANDNFEFTRNVTLTGLITGVLTFITAVIAMYRFVITPARQLLHSLETIGRGDMDHRIKVMSMDEFGSLAVGFNRMAENLDRNQKKLAEMAIRDSLTGLYNRREFERLLNDEIHRFRRHGHSVSLMILDIDHFKLINDQYGHQIGDQAIRTVADIVTNECRTGDVISRYGGEELAIILPETGAESAHSLAERICLAIAEFPVKVSPQVAIPITASLGTATVPDNAQSARDLVTAADLAMYEAKRSGRNCVRTMK